MKGPILAGQLRSMSTEVENEPIIGCRIVRQPTAQMLFDVRRRRRTVEKHADVFSREVVRTAQEIAHICNVVDTASQRRIPVLIYADKQGAVRHD
jgi:hypothetical protein